jgi:citronellol/citronellal dehydrogenase
MSLKGKTLFITGASRGIGREIALKAAQDGANIVIAAKSTEEHPKLGGSIFTVAKEVEAAGGRRWQFNWMYVIKMRLQLAMQQAVAHLVGLIF